MHAATTKNNHSKLGSRRPYTLCLYIVISDPGIHLATTKTVGAYRPYILIGQLVVYVTDVPIVEIVKEGSHARRACSFLAAESLFFLAALLSSQPFLGSMVSFEGVSKLPLSLGVGKRHYGLFPGAVPILLPAQH